MSIYCLVYTSVASQKMSDEDLKDLLKKSRLKNAALNITGMLLYLDPFFIQILEGEKDIINARYEVIKLDARHNNVKLIYKRPIEERYFPNWMMGFNKPNEDDLNAIEGFSDFWQRPTAVFFSDSPDEVSMVLNKFLVMFKNETLF